MILYAGFFVALAILVSGLWWFFDEYTEKKSRQKNLEKYGDGENFQEVSVLGTDGSSVKARLIEKRESTSIVYFPCDSCGIEKGTVLKGIRNSDIVAG